MAEHGPFPFVVGCGRSGTTLVRAMLDAHPAIAVPDESYFPAWFGRHRERYERPEGFALEVFLADLTAHESFARWGLDAAEVRAALAQAAPTTFADAVRAYYLTYARAHAKPRYADKTPIFALHINLLAGIFPEAVFVHIVRDVRAVVLSRVEAAWGTKRIEFEALQWKSHIARARAQGRALPADRYREFHYEQLLDDPEAVARSLCSFARLDFDPVMLRYHEHALPMVAAMTHPEEHRNLLRPPTKGLRDWRQELTTDQVQLVEQLTGTTMESFGYTREAPTPRAGIRVRALEARARYACTMGYKSARSAAWRLMHPNELP
jgi:hypothetical protein